MNFSVDKKNKKINVEREFAAPLANVWKAWTESEILDQWWAPKPWRAQTKTMDFREGGYWLYAMVGPDESVHWSRADYIAISPMKSFKGRDYFCDKEGNINPSLPASLWVIQFSESEGKTVVNIDIEYENLADLETIIEMGFKEGFTAGLQNLEELLNS